MPYVQPERRQYLNREGSVPRDPGELNYMLTMRCQEAFHEGGIALDQLPLNLRADCLLYVDHGIDHNPRYADFNAVMGALDCCSREWERRMCGRLHINEHGYVRFWTVLDSLSSTARDLYADMIAPYEDHKIQQNGDVYL